MPNIEAETGNSQEKANFRFPENQTKATEAGTSESRETDRLKGEEALFKEGWEQIFEGYKEVDFDHYKKPTLGDYRQTYNTNNGIINAVDSGGRKFARPIEDGDEQELQRLGFTRDSKMGVNLSNSSPEHPDARERWKAIWEAKNARDRAKAEKTEGPKTE